MMSIRQWCRLILIRQGRFCIYVIGIFFWLIGCLIQAHSSGPWMQQTLIKGQVNTIEGTVPPSAKVAVLKHKKDERACETCETKINADGSYTIETSLPPGPYTLIAYDGKRYLKDAEDRELKRGLNDKVDFTLGSPSAYVRVRGTATDTQGAVLPSAMIILYAAGCKTCEIDRATANENGEFVFEDMAGSETYLVATQLGGQVWSYNTLNVSEKGEQQVALAFQPPTSEEVVNVTASEPQTSVRTSINLPDLPLNSRSVWNLTVDGADVASTTSLSSSNPSINGSRFFDNRFTIDGIVTHDTLASSPQSPISSSAIVALTFSPTGYQNAQLNNSYSRQIDLVVRTGSNDFHGRVDYQVMNDALDSRRFFSLPGFDIFRQHIGSAQLSGPIWKDHFFFSFNYELDRRGESPTFSSILASQVTLLNQQLRRLGLPTEDLRRFVTTADADLPLLRLDYELNSASRFSITYGFRRNLIRKELSSVLNGTSATPSTARDIAGRNHFLSIHFTRTLFPPIVSESTYIYRSNSISLTPVEPDQPSVLIPGLALLGRTTNLLEGDGHRQSHHLVAEHINIQRGLHTLDTGGQFDYYGNRFRFAAFESGRAIIPGLVALSAPLPLADLFQIGRGGSEVRFSYSSIVAYIQDNFRVKPNLTLNLGLHYKAEFPPAIQHKDTQGWEPRAGFAWAFGGNQATLMRADYGLYRSFLPQIPSGFQLLMGGQGLQPVAPARRVTSIVGQPAASMAFNQFLTNGNFPTSPELATVYDPASQSPIVHALDVNLTRSLGSTSQVSISYAYRRGRHLLTSTNINLPPPTLINGRADFRNAFLDPNFAQIYQFETTGHSAYHGGILNVERKFSHGLAFNARYVFSKAIDDIPLLRAVDLIPGGSFESTPENVFDRRNERAVSDANPTHNFNLWAIWEVPKSQNLGASRIRRVLGTLYFSEGLQIESGRYFNVVAGSDANHDGNPLTDRPLTVGRDTFLGQRFIQLDARIGSNISLKGRKERHRLKLAVQIYNLFNRTNFASYNTVLGQPDLSGLDPQIVSGRRSLQGFDFRRPLTPNGFGLATSAFGPRRIQLEAGYQF